MTPRPPRARETTVLIADDQADVRAALGLLLKSEGIASIAVEGAQAALDAARSRELACALIDLNYTRDTTSGAEGLGLLARLREQAPELPIVVMTAWSSVPLVV
ncbi:MAG: response regulator, partial [Proteobacteria bacterium]|nr:response regulator [Pseudomonadota bacterium]